MTTSFAAELLSNLPLLTAPAGSVARGRTAHLKAVPESRAVRDRIRARCRELAARLDKSQPLTLDEMEQLARGVLGELAFAEGFVGWTMVALASEFWRDQVAAVPPARRLLLLPHCLPRASTCPAEYDEVGLQCAECGGCVIGDLQQEAKTLGYQVLVAEGSPVVLKLIVHGGADAIIGVACLNVLEKALDKILLAGIPCLAVPLLSSSCRDTAVDEDWVRDMIHTRQAPPPRSTRTYLHLLRAAANLLLPDTLDRLAPRVRGGPRLAERNGQGLEGLDPVASTEALAYDFLAKGGKYARPFITLAVYDALTGGQATRADGARHAAAFPAAVHRVALAIETFHKASLVHDDIEDDDAFRYGEPALHRQYGRAIALNVGDYLIGLGYRLVSREARTLGAEATADLLESFAAAHVRLCEGQGAELLWRDGPPQPLPTLDVLKLYALKTAPAFEAALYAGVRLAGPADRYAPSLKQFARYLGVAFQILNDLHDWCGDDHNKLTAGGDTLGGRPTVLLALALERLPPAGREELLALLGNDPRPAAQRLQRVRQLYREFGVFDHAYRLVDKYQQRAEAVADQLEPEEFRRLLRYLIASVLDRPEEHATGLVEPIWAATDAVP